MSVEGRCQLAIPEMSFAARQSRLEGVSHLCLYEGGQGCFSPGLATRAIGEVIGAESGPTRVDPPAVGVSVQIAWSDEAVSVPIGSAH